MPASQVPGKEDVIVVCPMSQAQQEVYRRLVNSHDYVLLRDSEVPCQCGSGEQRKNCCYKYVPQDEVECFDITDIRVTPHDDMEEGYMPWYYFMLVAIVQVGTLNFPCGPTPSKASAQAPLNIYSFWAISQACKVGNHLDLVRVCPRDPKLKQEKDQMFAKVAFGTDDPDVIEQNDKLVSFDTLNREQRTLGKSKF